MHKFVLLRAADNTAGIAGFSREPAPYTAAAGKEQQEAVFTVTKGNWSSDEDFERVNALAHGAFGSDGLKTPSDSAATGVMRALLGISSARSKKGFRGIWSAQHVWGILNLLERARTAYTARDKANTSLCSFGNAARRSVSRMLSVDIGAVVANKSISKTTHDMIKVQRVSTMLPRASRDIKDFAFGPSEHALRDSLIRCASAAESHTADLIASDLHSSLGQPRPAGFKAKVVSFAGSVPAGAVKPGTGAVTDLEFPRFCTQQPDGVVTGPPPSVAAQMHASLGRNPSQGPAPARKTGIPAVGGWKWAVCAREGCACTASFNGELGAYCCMA